MAPTSCGPGRPLEVSDATETGEWPRRRTRTTRTRGMQALMVASAVTLLMLLATGLPPSVHAEKTKASTTFEWARRWAKHYQASYRFWLNSSIFVLNVIRVREAEPLLSSTKNINKSRFYQFLHPLLGLGLLNSGGSKWLHRRRILTPTFHFNILNGFHRTFVEECELLVRTLDEHAVSGRATALQPVMSRFTLSTICDHMDSICKNHFLQQLYRKIDGATLSSKNERNLNCVITFQTHSILQRFMLRFDMLQLDCNDHLFVYDGAHAVGSHKADLTCKDTKQSVAALFTKTNFLTFKYVTDNWGTETNGFKMVITSVKDSKINCADFRCNQPEFCIHTDLLCDGVNHCADGSDEAVGSLCPAPNEYIKTIFGIDLTWVILSGVVSLIACVCIVGVTICVYLRNSRPGGPGGIGGGGGGPNSSIQLNQMIESNGSSKHLHATLPRETTTLPASGNLHHPAGPLGYLRIPHKLMAKVRPIWCLAN